MATLRKLLRRLEEQPARDRETFTKLANRGWFLSPRMPVAAIPLIGEAMESAPDEVDEAVAQHLRQYFSDVESGLVKAYPHRSHLFREGFWAHRECKYALSIPVFLAQADGIFYDNFGKPFFRRSGQSIVRNFSSSVTGHFIRAVLHPLTGRAPLWWDNRSRDSAIQGLNRHDVLHGMKVDYNTELNSLKAVSFLDNLAWVLNRHEYGC